MSTEPPGESPPTSRIWIVSALAAVVACVCALAWFGTRSSSPVTAPEPGPAEIVGDRIALPAGGDVRVFWRAIPAAGPNTGVIPPYEESFEITASAGADGKGAITGEQLFTRLAHLPGGRVVKAWVVEVAPKTLPEDGTTVVVTASPSEQLSRWVRLDAKSRAVLFVEVQMGPKPEPEPEPEPEPGEEAAPPP